jgi:hypothetical protein
MHGDMQTENIHLKQERIAVRKGGQIRANKRAHEGYVAGWCG